jgi:predicted transcriptional regulator
MRYRSPEEIFASILNAAGSGREMTLTKLIFNCMIPHSKAIECSTTLVRGGLLEFDKIDRVFRTTQKGFKFLELHNEMSEIFKIEKETKPLGILSLEYFVEQ